jgi:hypothetical protein
MTSPFMFVGSTRRRCGMVALAFEIDGAGVEED